MKSVRILGKTYSLHWVEKQQFKYEDCGHCDYEKQEIAVVMGYHKEQERDTLLHEILHGIEHEMGLDLAEEEIRSLATGLYAVFMDNPDLLKYLKDADT